MLEESEALSRILESVAPGAITWIPVELGLGQVIAHDLEGGIDSPPFDNSSMDGYAVRAQEAKTGSKLIFSGKEQAAGIDLSLALESGEAIRIFTGAPIPEGADAVVMQEDVEVLEGKIRVLDGVEAGENVRRRGGDICAGQMMMRRGDVVTASKVGLLASQGVAEIPVHARPLVQIVTTGDELVSPGDVLAPGEIYNSNAPMLQMAVQEAGGVGMCSHAVDDREVLTETLKQAFAAADMVVIAGGVSVGDRDYVKDVLDDLGVVTDFWRVKVKPGKPFLFGQHPSGAKVFGLPGNPVSSFVTFQLFVKPVIRLLLGERRASAANRRVQAVAAESMTNRGDRPHYLRGIVDGEAVRLSGTQQSHAIFGLSLANCLVRLEPEQKVEAGDRVEVVLL